MKNIILLTLSWVSFTALAAAQSNYRSGYIIKANGDTVKGYINYREWNKSPKFIDFKDNVNSERPVIYNVNSLKSFQVTGLDNYISYIGPVTTGKISMMDLTAAVDSGMKQDSVFLKVLSSGPNVALLSHVDNIKHRYFIMESGKLVELKYYVYLNDRNFIVEIADFRDQINALLQKYAPGNKAQNDLKRAAYNGDLIKYIHIINGNVHDKETTSKSTSRFFIGAAAAYNIINFDGPSSFGYQSRATSFAPIISIGMDIIPNKNVQKYFTRLELYFASRTATFNGAAGYYDLKEYSIMLSPQFLVNLYNEDKFKFFVGGGISIGLNNSSGSKLIATKSGIILTPYASQTKGESYVSLNQGQYFKDPYPFSTMSTNLTLRTGVIINKRFEMYISGAPVSFGESKDSNYSYNSSRIAFGINYLLK